MNDVMLKLRLQRLLWNVGYFVRIEVPLSTFVPERFRSLKRFDITDIDVVGIRLDFDLQPDYVICDCKSGERVKLFDRIFWLRGVMDFFKARKGYLAITRETEALKDIASRFNILVINEEDLKEMEKRLSIQDKWIGSCNPTLPAEIRAYREELRENHKKEINYLIYGYWMDPDFYQLKRIITVGKGLSKKQNFSSEAFRWAVVEALIRFTLSLCMFSGKMYNIKEEHLKDESLIHLYGGFISKKEREDILNYISRILSTYEKEPKIATLKLEPDYLNPLVEIIWRLTNQPIACRELPRFMDLLCYEYLLKNKQFSLDDLSHYFKEVDILMLVKLAKDIIEFYLDVSKIDKNMFQPLIKS